jgi:hypothetical protein
VCNQCAEKVLSHNYILAGESLKGDSLEPLAGDCMVQNPFPAAREQTMHHLLDPDPCAADPFRFLQDQQEILDKEGRGAVALSQLSWSFVNYASMECRVIMAAFTNDVKHNYRGPKTEKQILVVLFKYWHCCIHFLLTALWIPRMRSQCQE